MEFSLLLIISLLGLLLLVRVTLSITYIKNATQDMLLIKVLLFNFFCLYEKNSPGFFQNEIIKFFSPRQENKENTVDNQEKSKMKKWKNKLKYYIKHIRKEIISSDAKSGVQFHRGQINLQYSCCNPAVTAITYGTLQTFIGICMGKYVQSFHMDIEPDFTTEKAFLNAECIITFHFGNLIHMIRILSRRQKNGR